MMKIASLIAVVFAPTEALTSAQHAQKPDSPSTELGEKTFIFIRHGDSLWNEAKRNGTAGLHNSCLNTKGTFVDAPLTMLGVLQANKLHTDLLEDPANPEAVKTLLNKAEEF